jgi:hypothetical protein
MATSNMSTRPGKLHSADQEEVLSRPYLEFVHPDDRGNDR